MKIVVACGGTGGHSFPGLAVAAELRRRGHEVTVWTAGREIEDSVMQGWDGPVFTTKARPLSPRHAFAIVRSFLRCRREMRCERPEVLLAMGSYASLTPVLAAKSQGVRVYLHEANTIPGRAVDFLARFAEKVAISFEMTATYLPGIELVRTGLPVRAGIAAGTRFPFIPPKAFVVFVTGGSQGAHAVNEMLVRALVMLKGELDARRAERPLYVIHQSGASDEGFVKTAYAKVSLPSRVHAFEREMANAFASADVVVSRAGASTCFELAACGKPALLIPLPSAMRNHQHFNADAFAVKGAADEGIQEKLSAKQVFRYLLDKYDHPERLAEMAKKIRALATPDAASRVADLVTRAVRLALLALLPLSAMFAGAETLESPSLRLSFASAEKGFGVETIENRSGEGARFVHTEGAKGPTFWQLSFRRAPTDRASTVTIDNRSACRGRRLVRRSDGGAEFVWEGVDLPGEKGAVNVRARVAFASDGSSAWTLDVQNTGVRYGLFETRYPTLGRVALSGEADHLLPRSDTGARLVHKAPWGRRASFGCMGYSPMMTAFFKGERGLYVAAHDSQARLKTLSLSKEHDLAFVTPVENAGLPGKAAEGPRYAVTVAAVDGDWWAAAKRYRAWALTTPWTAKGPIWSRRDSPRRLAEIPLWLNTHAFPDEASNTLARAHALFPDVTVGLHWHLWQHSGHDVNYPEYFPEQPGTREVLAARNALGAEPMPYTNGRLWSTNLVSYPLARPYALMRDDGQPRVERYGVLTPPMSPICPATKMWDETLNDFARRVLDLGAGSIFLDQIGACGGAACFSSEHGHPVGGGTWYFEGYQALLAKTHAAYSAKGAFVTTEGSGEQWMNVIDGYLNVTRRGLDDVPFFHAVYSGYTTYFCTPENHNDDPDSFWAAQARELAWGQALGWFHPLVLEDAPKVALLRRLVAFRQKNLDLLAYGSLVDGVRFLDPLPEQPVTWLGRKAFFLWKVKDAPLSPPVKGAIPSVCGCVWRSAATGRLAAVVANLSGERRRVRFAFNGGERVLDLAPRALERIDR